MSEPTDFSAHVGDTTVHFNLFTVNKDGSLIAIATRPEVQMDIDATVRGMDATWERATPFSIDSEFIAQIALHFAENPDKYVVIMPLGRE